MRMGPASFCLRTYPNRADPQAFLAINTHYQPIDTSMTVVKLNYEKSVSYILDDSREPYMLALTLPLSSEPGPLSNLEEYLKMSCQSFDEPDDKTKNKLSIVHEGYLEQPVYKFSVLEQKINEGALAAREGIDKLGGYVERGKNRVSAIFSKKDEKEPKQDKQQALVEKEELPPQRESLPEQKQLSAFQRLKAKAMKAFEKTSAAISRVVDPVVTKGKELNTKLCDKIDKSDSKVLHSIKSTFPLMVDFAVKSNNAIKSAFYTIQESKPAEQPAEKEQAAEPKVPIEDISAMPIEAGSPLQEIEGRDDQVENKNDHYNYQKFDEESK